MNFIHLFQCVSQFLCDERSITGLIEHDHDYAAPFSNERASMMSIEHDHDYAGLLSNDVIDNNVDRIQIDDNIEMMLSIDQNFGVLEYDSFPFTHEVKIFENKIYFRKAAFPTLFIIFITFLAK